MDLRRSRRKFRHELHILPGETPCLNCLLGTIPLGGDTCDINGILPQAVQMVVAHQTMEAMKLYRGIDMFLEKDAVLRFVA